MTEFNESKLIEDYVAAIDAGEPEQANEIARTIPAEYSEKDRVRLMEDVVTRMQLTNTEGKYDKEIAAMETAIVAIKAHHASQDSNSEESTEAEPVEANTAESADTVAEEAQQPEAVAESGGYAVTAEEEEQKSENQA